MKHKKMTVSQVADYTGITIRALHYYDEIGLLQPSAVTEAKYRIYSETDLDRLQQILFYKEVGFTLKEIKELIGAPVYTKQEALQRHLELLNQQKGHLEKLIELVTETLSGNEEHALSVSSDANDFKLQEKYRKEVIERWDSTCEYQEFANRFSKKDRKEQEKQWNNFLINSQKIFERLAEYERESPVLDSVQTIVCEWQEYLSENFYYCSDDMLLNLGEIYEFDERFSTYINRFGSKQLASFFNQAIKAYCAAPAGT